MQRLKATNLVLLGGAVFALSLLVLVVAQNYGRYTPPVQWFSAVPILGTAAVCIVAGWKVKRRDGKRRVTGVGAARVVALAFAAAYLGSGFLGHFLAQLLFALPQSVSPYPREQAVASAVCALSALLLLISGMVVERWCLLDDDDSEGTPDPTAPAAG
ncbi:MAG: DUF3180 domain-containing protein [Buchananella hordeovulneris]|nr:DUF3180 domain-containing protein [Buchananella hordeovulneris]